MGQEAAQEVAPQAVALAAGQRPARTFSATLSMQRVAKVLSMNSGAGSFWVQTLHISRGDIMSVQDHAVLAGAISHNVHLRHLLLRTGGKFTTEMLRLYVRVSEVPARMCFNQQSNSVSSTI